MASPSSTTAPTRRPRPALPLWNAVAALLLALYLAGLVLLSVAALAPDLFGGPLARYADQRASLPLWLQALSGVGAFVAYRWPRRQESRSFALLVTTGLAVTTIALGLASYWGCSTEQSPFWTPLSRALYLIIGNVEDGCGFPLALQLARLCGPLVLLVTAFGIVAAVFQAQVDRRWVRFAPSLVLLLGLTEDAIPLVRRLVAGRARRTVVAVLVEDASNRMIKLARELGARVVVCDIDDQRALEVLLRARGRFKVRAAYLASGDVAQNLRWADQLRRVADTSKPTTPHLPPRMIVRIDDPWQAEYWRRTNAYRTPDQGTAGSVRWMSDALSVYEITATLLVERIHADDHDRLVLMGTSPLALAICAELAQREREDELLGRTRRPSFPDLVLLGTQAEALRQQHRLRQERFGNTAASELITVVADKPSPSVLHSLLPDDQRPALIIADPPGAGPAGQARQQLGTYLAALHPRWTIFDWSAATSGLAAEPIMERLYLFGLTTELPPDWPVDSWERAARMVHERYLRQLSHPDPTAASHRGWDEGLDAFLKESNIRLVTTTLAAAEAVGRTWGPAGTGGAGTPLRAVAPLSPAQLDAMAELEHASWLKHHRDNGWRYGTVRDDSRRVHPALLPWPELDEGNRERTRRNVADALHTLATLGYRSIEAVGPPPATGRWRPVQRTGEVTAVQTDAPWTWTNQAGETLQAAAGHWRVSDQAGQVWSVTPEIFNDTYVHVGGDRWRRVGQVLARPAAAGETVQSLEGPVTAQPGDWVLKGGSGEEWVVSSDHFGANYRPV